MEGQLTASVRWTDSIGWMVEQGVTHFIEIGPKDVLAGLIKRISKEVETRTVSTPADINVVLGA
ncbi:MAG: hypothetical protein U0401_03685 [Anaerolineae bacterium]